MGGDGDEEGRGRLSISGWFHAAQEGEEGYQFENVANEFKSSREQLVSTQICRHVFSPHLFLIADVYVHGIPVLS